MSEETVGEFVREMERLCSDAISCVLESPTASRRLFIERALYRLRDDLRSLIKAIPDADSVVFEGKGG